MGLALLSMIVMSGCSNKKSRQAAHFKKLVPAIGALCEKVNAETFYFD